MTSCAIYATDGLSYDMLYYTADFETTADDLTETRVWAWAVCTLKTYDITTGTNIEGFLKWCENAPNARVYFHNLKFDGKFIVDSLLNAGWEWIETVGEQAPYRFTTLISDMNQFYSIKLFFKKGHYIEFCDSLKVISLPVAKIPAAFGFEQEDAKLSIDYTEHRSEDHELTEEEIEYISADVRIVARALGELIDHGATRITAGSNAIAEYKKTIGGEKGFRRTFPVCDYDAEIRPCYKGGFTYVNPEYKGKDIGAGIVLDVNSLYPSVMASVCGELLPYGDPVLFEGKYEHDERYPLYVQTVHIDFTLKPDHIPCIQLKGNLSFLPTEYVRDSKGEQTLVLTSVDLELLEDHYDINSIRYGKGWKFKASRALFEKFIMAANEEKIEAARTKNAGKRYMAKLKMNSSYGKMATNPVKRCRKPMLGDDGIVHYVMMNPEHTDGMYLPVGAFITAWARNKTIRAAQAVKHRFIYADTDSLHLAGTEIPEELDVDEFRLGAWKVESEFRRARFLRPKTYIEDDVKTGKLTIHCAGLPERCHENVTWENFRVGAKYPGKLYSKTVKGGIILYEGDFVIRKELDI